MSANSWGLYRDRNTGRVGEYPADAAAIFDNLEPVDSEYDDCVDCDYEYDNAVEVDDYDFEYEEDEDDK